MNCFARSVGLLRVLLRSAQCPIDKSLIQFDMAVDGAVAVRLFGDVGAMTCFQGSNMSGRATTAGSFTSHTTGAEYRQAPVRPAPSFLWMNMIFLQ